MEKENAVNLAEEVQRLEGFVRKYFLYKTASLISELPSKPTTSMPFFEITKLR